MSDKCCYGSETSKQLSIEGEYVCYCSKITKAKILEVIIHYHTFDVDEVIKFSGAMQNSNCAINNPKGVCCYGDILAICQLSEELSK